MEFAAALPPGTALDLGCADGAAAVWLARRGWRVTAADVSATALGRAAAACAAAGVRDRDRIAFERHDLAVSFPAGAYDLVSALYLESPVDFPGTRVLQRAATAVTPGGLLLVTTHASIAPCTQADLDAVAAELNGRPRETLGWRSPAERFLEPAEAG